MHEKIDYKGRSTQQMKDYGLLEDEVREILLSYPSTPDKDVENLWGCRGPIRRDTTISVRYTIDGETTVVLRVVVLERLI